MDGTKGLFNNIGYAICLYFSMTGKEMSMDKNNAKKILDDISKSINTLKQYSTYLCDSRANEIHMSNCIRSIAEAIGLEVNKKPWRCDGMQATEISFVYNNIRFFELENYRKCEEDAKAD